MSTPDSSMTTGATAAGFPEEQVRARARNGTAEAFPPAADYGRAMFGAVPDPAAGPVDDLDAARLVPPVFMPRRLEKLIDLGREPEHTDVDLSTVVGGFRSALPVFLSAFGSTELGSRELGVAASTQAGQLGVPMVIGENMVPVHGFGGSPILARIEAYLDAVADGLGGVVVQQSTEDADSEVWNLVHSSPAAAPLLETGRLAFELKVGQGAKPGLGGMTVLDAAEATRLADRFSMHDVFGSGERLRCATPGTFTEEIVRQQIRFMRNNFPRAKVWVKFHPGRDIARAAEVAWAAGADSVTVDGAEGGTGWAPTAFLRHVGLPLAECLRRIGPPSGCLLVTGRMWEGSRVVRGLALGATAAGLGRAALLAVAEDPRAGLVRLVECLALEARLLISALGKYTATDLDPEDLWWPGTPAVERVPV
ncbi:glutamate synthase-related protein [Actinokineospora spheciospongiae]|uniref:glutamate synthase-related protein n=1 Tax=Actinokineospora spheciospongiae TaxID=909613 RepID=UPI000D989D52|nr:glutamate synthase-related protein [Actinokineospora spheciospongiae]PWW54821.1 glutamate synthase (NADPH) GltB2 subunit [Actinokineospora spheciospongiae]